MRKDHGISNQASAALEIIRALGDGDEQLNHDLIEGETGLFEAIELALGEIRDCETQLAGIKHTSEQLNSRKSRVQGRSDRLRGLIDQAFQIAEIKSHVFPCETVTIKKVPPSLRIVDESQIPSSYFKPQPPKLDRKELTTDAKNGKVEGVEMSNGGLTIQIRRS